MKYCHNFYQYIFLCFEKIPAFADRQATNENYISFAVKVQGKTAQLYKKNARAIQPGR
jgi:hypothetical protein